MSTGTESDRSQTTDRAQRRGKRNTNGEGTISLRSDGRYQGRTYVDQPDGTRKRITVYGRTWDECHDKIVNVQSDRQRGLPVSTTKLTVGEYMRYWLEEVAKPSVRETTFVSYESLNRLYIEPGLGKHKLKSVQVRHIRLWLNSTASTCQCCAQGKDAKRAEKRKGRCCATGKCCEDYPAPSSLRYLLRLLRAALQSAVDEELISRNVAKQMKPPKGPDRKVTPWDAQEAQAFLQAVAHDRLYGLWAVGLGIGLRRGEALGLRWCDVDLDGGQVHVRRTLHRVSGELRLDEVKTESSAASVPLPKPLVAILRRHKRMQSAERLAAGEDWEDHGLVFTTHLGRPLEPRNVNRRFAALCKQAEVRPVRMHDLRHSCATLLFTLGVDAATVQRILRHSSITVTTGTYVEVLNSVQHDAVSKLNELFA